MTPPPPTFTISAARRNELVGQVRRNRLAPGQHCRLAGSAEGTMVSGDADVRWRHPWWTTARWHEGLGAWLLNVMPGFVNGVDPLMQAAQIWDAAGGVGDVPLLDTPEVKIGSWREVGGKTGALDETVPRFFLAQGVQRPKALADAAGLTDYTLDERTLGRRILRAVDVAVAVARASIVSTVDVVDGSGTSGLVAMYSAGIDTKRLDQAGTRPRLRVESRHTPPKVPSLAERVFGFILDESEDTRLISTLYALSPADADDAAMPDETWTIHAKHNTWWNLGHAPRNQVPAQPPAAITLFTGLLGGVADFIFNQLLSFINEWAQKAEQMINGTTNEGNFWST